MMCYIILHYIIHIILGPLFSTILCHLLYALAVLVPIHPKAAKTTKINYTHRYTHTHEVIC